MKTAAVSVEELVGTELTDNMRIER